MLVLGIVVLAFLVVHFIQFWAKMQMAEIAGTVEALPPAAGTLFLQEAFGQPWTLVVYAVGFVALWFHLTHGFWSMFQSVGWDNKVWMNRLKCIGNWWVSIVVALFLAEAIVFTVRAHEKFYLTDEALREQYKDMIVPMLEEDFGPDADQLGAQIEMSPYGQVSMGLRQMHSQMANQLEQVNTPEGKEMVKGNPEMASQIEELQKRTDALENVVKLFDYLESADNKPENLMPASAGNQPY
jgi:succinate dehydrogenase/fumarate reductase cytochrome b subunit